MRSKSPHPKFVVCDTMNYSIQSKKDALMSLLERVDLLMVNDSEARELSGDWNIHGPAAGSSRTVPSASWSSRASSARC